jgi:hypothetical protein
MSSARTTTEPNVTGAISLHAIYKNISHYYNELGPTFYGAEAPLLGAYILCAKVIKVYKIVGNDMVKCSSACV